MQPYLQTYQISDSKNIKKTHILFCDNDGETFLLCKQPLPDIGNVLKGEHKYFLEEGEADDLIFDLANNRVEQEINYCSKCVGSLYTED